MSQDPLSPAYIVRKFGRKLTPFEHDEILSYGRVYYHGQNATKTYNASRTNYGYDSADGDAQPVTRDHVAYRYELLQLIGQGSFGRVFRAIDHLHKRVVALKMLKNKKRFRKQGQVELRILREIADNDTSNSSHCMHILDSGDFRGHIYFTSEMLQCDLYALLCKGNLKGLPLHKVKKYSY